MSELKPFNINSNIKKELCKPLDKRLIKTRKSAGTELSYISGNTCIDILNKTFGYAWSFEIISSEIIKADDQIIKQTQDWKTKNWSWPKGVNPPADKIQTDSKGVKYIVLDNQGSIAWVHGKLTVPFVDENNNTVYISKSAWGSQLITGPGQTQSMTGLKAAGTDALKKAATLFGIALELYREMDEQEYFEEMNEELFSPWTDELIEQYKEQFDYINQILALNNYTVDDLAYWIAQATEEQYASLVSMDPSYMDTFIEVLKAEEDIIHPGGK